MQWNCAGVPCGYEGDIQGGYVGVGKPKVLLRHEPGVQPGDGLEELLYYLK